MATQTPPINESKTTPDFDAAIDRMRELNEQALDFTRKAGASVLDAQESTLKTVAEYQDKVAEQTKVDWIASLARAQAAFTREATALYASTARDLLK